VPQSSFRIVIDTNALLRSFVAGASPSAKIRRAAEKRLIVPLLSKPVVDEYRAVLSDGQLRAKFPQITTEVVEIAIRRLRFVSDYLQSPAVDFEFVRDPRDQKFIELAIGLRATHILSFDNDLLSLPKGASDAGRRFRQRLPGVEVMDAGSFLRAYGAELGIRH
jgi:putative PIN family toxin of toxin-antitoxin system